MDVFMAAPEIENLQGMGGCDILYLPELNVDDPYYNLMFMSRQEKDKYGREGRLDILRQVYMSHDTSIKEEEETKLECIRRQLMLAAAGGCLLYTSPSPRDLSTSRMPSSA